VSFGLIASTIFVVLTLLPGRADTPYIPQGSLRDLRFSPDGRHVLAQNESEITPDSWQIVFVSGGTRLDRQRISLLKTTAHVQRRSIAGDWNVPESMQAALRARDLASVKIDF